MKLLEVIKCDFSRIESPTLRNMIRCYLFPQGSLFRYVVWLRVVQKIKGRRMLKIFFGIPAYLLYRHYEFKYGVHVNSNMEIGPGLHIEHGDGVYLNCCAIGKNFTCLQGVTIGVNHNGQAPVVKDNVTVFAGAVVIGNITLNDGCKVGALAFVNKDVDSNTIVAGNPAKMIRRLEE